MMKYNLSSSFTRLILVIMVFVLLLTIAGRAVFPHWRGADMFRMALLHSNEFIRLAEVRSSCVGGNLCYFGRLAFSKSLARAA